MGGWRLLQAQGKEEVEMEMAALVVPEGRPIRAITTGRRKCASKYWTVVWYIGGAAARRDLRLFSTRMAR